MRHPDHNHSWTFRTFGTAAIALALTVAAQSHADEHVFTATDPVWQAECGSCHVAYPPQLLPADSWRQMMKELDRHFGVDASLDAATARSIGAFLEANAGRSRRTRDAAAGQRITETRWFRHEHDEVLARLWNDPRVKSAANCGACHTQAERGDYRERTLRMPK